MNKHFIDANAEADEYIEIHVYTKDETARFVFFIGWEEENECMKKGSCYEVDYLVGYLIGDEIQDEDTTIEEVKNKYPDVYETYVEQAKGYLEY